MPMAVILTAAGCGVDSSLSSERGDLSRERADLVSAMASSSDLALPDGAPFACAGEANGPPPVVHEEACTNHPLIPAPTSFASVLDLRDTSVAHAGRCAAFAADPFKGLPLPSDPSAYPLKILLPALDGPDCDCAPICNGLSAGPPTAFGLAFDTTLNLGHAGRVLTVRVPPPWMFVSGGGGEAYAWPCVGGYQEFYQRSCISLAWGSFGFATQDPNAPSVEAILDLADVAEPFALEPTSCCLLQ